MHLERLIFILEFVGQKGNATVADISQILICLNLRLIDWCKILSAPACWTLLAKAALRLVPD